MAADPSYHYRKKKLRRRRRFIRILLASFVVLLILGGIIIYDLIKNQSREIEGENLTISQTFGEDDATQLINEPTYTMKLPADWKETARINDTYRSGATWTATKDKESDRFITVFVDKIPQNYPLNRVIPVGSASGVLTLGNVSDRCQSFTRGGTFDEAKAVKTRPTLSKWEDVEFICNMPRPSENEIGTSSEQGINTVTVNGDQQGKHKYFFVYTDHNTQPNNQIFVDILNSFRAK